GRALLDLINSFLGEGAGAVVPEQVDALGSKLRALAEGLRSTSQSLEERLASAGIEEARADMARVSAAFVRLLGLVSGSPDAPAPEPEPPQIEAAPKAQVDAAGRGGRILI